MNYVFLKPHQMYQTASFIRNLVSTMKYGGGNSPINFKNNIPVGKSVLYNQMLVYTRENLANNTMLRYSVPGFKPHQRITRNGYGEIQDLS